MGLPQKVVGVTSKAYYFTPRSCNKQLGQGLLNGDLTPRTSLLTDYTRYLGGDSPCLLGEDILRGVRRMESTTRGTVIDTRRAESAPNKSLHSVQSGASIA